MLRTVTCGILHHTMYLLHRLKITDPHGHLSMHNPQSWSQHHKECVMLRHQFLVLEVPCSSIWWVKTGPESALDLQSRPEPEGCKNHSRFICGYCCTSPLWLGFELPEGSTIGKATLSRWTFWGLLYLFLSFQASKAEFFWGNLVICRKWDKTRSPFLSLTTEAWQTWSNALALEQILKTN